MTDDGTYTIDPDGPEDQYGATDVFCEMTFSGGGIAPDDDPARLR